MANALYDKGRQSFLEGLISWNNDNIKAVLIDTAYYTVNLASHQYLSDIPAQSRVSVSSNFSGKTTTNGIAGASQVTFSLVVGDSCESIAIYKDTGSESTSILIAYIDTAVGLPITPNSSDILITWTGSIFKL